MDIHEYILNLEEQSKLFLDDLKPLYDAEITVKKEGWEWRKLVVKTDKIKVTNINVHTNITSKGIEITNMMIYGDFYLKGIFQFNAWISLKGLKADILKAKTTQDA